MNRGQIYNPPRIAASILGWLLKDDWATPLGDYQEYYNELAAEDGVMKARWWYRWQVVRLLPDRVFEKIYWSRVMLKNYFVLGFRNLLKNRIASFINLTGLSVAVGCCIAVFLFLRVLYTFDDFHENRQDIYLVGHTVERFDKIQTWGNSPLPLASALAADFPQIKRAVRFMQQGATVRAKGVGFRETVSFADAGFFDMLTFPLKKGQPNALEDPTAVIISAEMAEKYFREEDPLGAELIFTFSNGAEEPLVVRGVAEDFPSNASLKFDFLVGYDKLLSAGVTSLEDWGAFTDATLIQVPQPRDLELIAGQLEGYVSRQNDANKSWQIREFFFDSVANPAWDAWEIERRAMRAPEPWTILVFGLIALLMIAVSCFNYINIALGAAARRLKEIGIRKTAGAIKKQLIIQFLTENLVLCFCAMIVGLLFAQSVVVPLFNNLFVEQIPLNFMDNIGFWIFLVGLLAFTGLISGAYPAFYISSFQPVTILRGEQKLTAKKGLTRVLIGVQFMLAIITISISAFFFSIDGYLAEIDWGYTADRTLVVPVSNSEQYGILRAEALQKKSPEGP
ncbi:ABC transporter permease [bacterium]|nr:ABC transporter permease [bacterium]